MEKLTLQRMIENITLLWTLNEIPESPKENVINYENDGTRQLTLEREIQLASNFAFISASTDNMLRVMAACIEERSDQQGLTIRLASNTGDMSQTIEKFRDISNTIERAARRVNPRVIIRQDLFRQILQLDKPRILSRLRSKHATTSRKTAGKPALVDLLARALADPSIRGKRIGKANLEKVRSQSDYLSETFAKLEAISDIYEAPQLSLDILADLLRQIFDYDSDNLLKVLHTSSTIDPSLKVFLPEAIKKLGRYHSIANELVDAARNPSYTIFRHVSIEALEKPGTDIASITGNLQDFETVLQRNIGPSYGPKNRQQHSHSLTEARTKFQSRISNCAIPWKIHAEIQLLFFYEQNPNIPHPRAICSSKSACYLCDLFIQTHGEFHTPQTHGRLYDKWTLPKCSPDQPLADQRILSTMERFNTALEAKIVQSLNNRQHKHPHPTESILQIAKPWPSTSTLPRLAGEQTGAAISDSTFHDASYQESKESPAAIPCTPADLTAEDAPMSAEAATQSTDTNVCQRFDLNHDERRRASLSGPTDCISRTLSRGESLHQKLSSSPSSALVVHTPALDLHISWQWDQADCEANNLGVREGRWIQIKWLASGSCTEAGNKVANSIDVDMLASGQEKVLECDSASNLRALAIKNGEETLLLQWCDEVTLPEYDPSRVDKAVL